MIVAKLSPLEKAANKSADSEIVLLDGRQLKDIIVPSTSNTNSDVQNEGRSSTTELEQNKTRPEEVEKVPTSPTSKLGIQSNQQSQNFRRNLTKRYSYGTYDSERYKNLVSEYRQRYRKQSEEWYICVIVVIISNDVIIII